MPDLLHWQTPKTTRTSPDIQNEVFELMAHSLLRKFVEIIKQRKFYSIMVDVTYVLQSDLCHQELEVEEHVLGLYALKNCDSKTITDTILDILLRFVMKLCDAR